MGRKLAIHQSKHPCSIPTIILIGPFKRAPPKSLSESDKSPFRFCIKSISGRKDWLKTERDREYELGSFFPIKSTNKY